MMKKILATESAAVLLLFAMAMFAAAVVSVPQTTHAAFDDANLAVDTILSVGGYSLTASGATSTIATITVEASRFSFTLNSGSTLEITSSTGQAFSTDGQGFIATNTCTGGVSVLGFNATETKTIVVTPSSSSCSGAATTATAAAAAASSGGSGNGAPVSSGGGGGGGVYSAPVITTTTTGTDAVVAQLQAQVQSLIAQLNAILAARGLPSVGSFTRDLKVGAIGNDVKALQVYLNTHGYVIVSSGPGSSGNETTKFGGLTRAALVKLQKAAGITPAAGYFGAKTRAYIAAHP